MPIALHCRAYLPPPTVEANACPVRQARKAIQSQMAGVAQPKV
ncbi:hypothetical protein [Hydrogenophaga sp.]